MQPLWAEESSFIGCFQTSDRCVCVCVCVSEEPDGAGGGGGCGKPAAALRQHAVWETDPHLLQQTQHCESAGLVNQKANT